MSYIARCEKCGKKLMERNDSGLWHFQFGRYGQQSKPVVDLRIHGSVKITCLRKSCRHENVLDFFPGS